MPDTNPFILKMMQSGVLTGEDHGCLTQVSSGGRAVKAGATLSEQGQRPLGTPLVMRGFAYRYRLLRNGKRQILGILVPGDCCDIQGSILGSSDHTTAALTDCEIVWLSRERVDDLTLARSRVARAFWWATLVDECILRSWLTNMGQQDASRSLAHFLCEFLLRLQVVGCAESNSCELPFFQEDLADILGITGVHVSRTFKDLRERELVQVHQKRVSVPSVRALRTFCEFDPAYLHLNATGDQPAA